MAVVTKEDDLDSDGIYDTVLHARSLSDTISLLATIVLVLLAVAVVGGIIGVIGIASNDSSAGATAAAVGVVVGYTLSGFFLWVMLRAAALLLRLHADRNDIMMVVHDL
jgi:hypothetical protein